MHYPLTGLQHFLSCNLITPDATILANSVNNCTAVNTRCTMLFQQTAVDCCLYIGTATNELQAVYMVHALRVALIEMEKKLIHAQQGASDFSALEQKTLITLYHHAIHQLQELQSLINEHFSDIREIALPAFTKKPDELQTLQTNLSVPQLGLFIRLLVESGVIDGKGNISALISKVASMLKTRKAMPVSVESLRIKYYAPEKAAVNILKEYIGQMMQVLRKF